MHVDHINHNFGVWWPLHYMEDNQDDQCKQRPPPIDPHCDFSSLAVVRVFFVCQGEVPTGRKKWRSVGQLLSESDDCFFGPKPIFAPKVQTSVLSLQPSAT